jgi:anti-sigma regulatory factor (Ser/Thr protein kinase)
MDMSASLPACEHSRLIIPSDARYAEVAVRYAAAVAQLIGFDERAQNQIVNGLQVALTAIIRYSFEPHERAALDISCERIPAGLKILVRDKGLPFDGTAPASSEPKFLEQAPLSLRDHFDEIFFNNLGREGKEVVLIKHLPDRSLEEYEAVCLYEIADSLPAAEPLPQARMPCTVRSMEPADALEISKTVYRTYGYSYAHDYVYYPEKIIALNASGAVHSALAVTAENRVVGHCAFSLWRDNPQIAELGQGVIVPEYRSQGCFARLTAYLIAAARSRGLQGVFTEAVTVHPFSQKTALRMGLRDCAFLACLVPPTVDFKGVTRGPMTRAGMLTQFKYLLPPPSRPIYAPPQHAGMLRAIYANLNPAAPPQLQTSPPPMASEAGESIYSINLIRSLNFARMQIKRFGADIVADIRSKLRELSLQRWDVIHLVLSLSDPQTSLLCDKFEELGFFFAGILPLGDSSGDTLVLQYVNTVCNRYGVVQTASSFASDLVAYVKSCDSEGHAPRLIGT